jgi:hypothetical protein
VEVCHRLGLTPVYMEEFVPERPPPVEACRRAVESCEAFVLLLAHRYGARPPGEERSYTELEYGWALSRLLCSHRIYCITGESFHRHVEAMALPRPCVARTLVTLCLIAVNRPGNC